MDAHRSTAIAPQRTVARLVAAVATAAALVAAGPTASLAQSTGAVPGNDTFRVVESHTDDDGRLVATVALPERLRAQPPASDAVRVVADGNPVEAAIDAVAPERVAVAAVLDDAVSVDEASLTVQRGLLAEFFLQVDAQTPIVLASTSNGVIAGPSADRRVLLQALAQLPAGGERDAVGSVTAALDALETDGPKGVAVMTLGPDAVARDASALAARIESEGTLARWIDGSARATSVPEPLDSLAVPSVLTTAAVLPILDQLAADLGGQYRVRFTPVASAATTSVELTAGGERFSAALPVPAAPAPSTTATPAAPASPAGAASPASTVPTEEPVVSTEVDAAEPTPGEQAAPAEDDSSDNGLLIGVLLVGVGLLLAALAGFLLLRQRRAAARLPSRPVVPVDPATAALPAAAALPATAPSKGPGFVPVTAQAAASSARAQAGAPAAQDAAHTVAPPPPPRAGSRRTPTTALPPPPAARGAAATVSPSTAAPSTRPLARAHTAAPPASLHDAEPATHAVAQTQAPAAARPAAAAPAMPVERAPAAIAHVGAANTAYARRTVWGGPEGPRSMPRSRAPLSPTSPPAPEAHDDGSVRAPRRRTTWGGSDGATTGPRPLTAERPKSSHPKRSAHARAAGALLSPRTGAPVQGGSGSPVAAGAAGRLDRGDIEPGLDNPAPPTQPIPSPLAPMSVSPAPSEIAPADRGGAPDGPTDGLEEIAAGSAPRSPAHTAPAHDLRSAPATNGTPSTSGLTAAGDASDPARALPGERTAPPSPNGNGTAGHGARGPARPATVVPPAPAVERAPESTGARPIGGYRQCRRASPPRESHARPLGGYRTV